MAESQALENHVLEVIRFRFEMYKRLGEGALAQLTDADLTWRPNEASNSIAVIVQHLHGNMVSRWTNVLTEDGEKATRDRDAEFIEPESFRRETLLTQWDEGWRCLLDAVSALTADDLLREITIRHHSLTVLDGLMRQVTHVASHVGQIIWIAKARRGDAWQTLSIPRGESRNPEVTSRLEREYGGLGR